jgi:hypothetical protein
MFYSTKDFENEIDYVAKKIQTVQWAKYSITRKNQAGGQ